MSPRENHCRPRPKVTVDNGFRGVICSVPHITQVNIYFLTLEVFTINVIKQLQSQTLALGMVSTVEIAIKRQVFCLDRAYQWAYVYMANA